MTRNRYNSGATRKQKSLVISSGVTAEWISSFYANYDSTRHKAACSECNKREAFDGEEFMGCAGCEATVYCSRECQKAHWKKHKAFCTTNKCTDDTKEFKVTLRKLKKFQGLFYPLIELMIHLRFALRSKELNVDLDSMPSTHTVYMHLGDIPEDNKDAKKPRICIKSLEPIAVADMDARSRAKFEGSRRRLSHEGHVVSYTLVYPCLQEGKCYTWTQSCIHRRDPFYYFRRYDKQEMLEKIVWLTQGINGMAKGTRPDLYKEVKKFLKEEGRHLRGANPDSVDNGSGSGKSNKNLGRNRITTG